jgi:hypothetical protein
MTWVVTESPTMKGLAKGEDLILICLKLNTSENPQVSGEWTLTLTSNPKKLMQKYERKKPLFPVCRCNFILVHNAEIF